MAKEPLSIHDIEKRIGKRERLLQKRMDDTKIYFRKKEIKTAIMELRLLASWIDRQVSKEAESVTHSDRKKRIKRKAGIDVAGVTVATDG